MKLKNEVLHDIVIEAALSARKIQEVCYTVKLRTDIDLSPLADKAIEIQEMLKILNDLLPKD